MTTTDTDEIITAIKSTTGTYQAMGDQIRIQLDDGPTIEIQLNISGDITAAYVTDHDHRERYGADTARTLLNVALTAKRDGRLTRGDVEDHGL